MGKLALTIPRTQIRSRFDDWTPALMDRDICENDPEHVQIIPYIVMVDPNTKSVLMYQRGQAGGEDKLKAKWSIGIGGHVDEMPVISEDENIASLLAKEACREIKEEIGVDIDPEDSAVYDAFYSCHAILQDRIIYLPFSDNTVDHVHMGIVIIQEIDPSEISAVEEGVIEKHHWVPIDELVRIAAGLTEDKDLEYWSMFALPLVVGHIVDDRCFQKINQGFDNATPEQLKVLQSRSYLLETVTD